MSAVNVFRIVKKAYSNNAYNGDGARLTNGRWHSKGTSVVYCSSSLALAALETLVHVQPLQGLPEYAVVPASIPRSCIMQVEIVHKSWKRIPNKVETRDIGDAWVASNASVALEVPSIIVPSERNFILNPSHRDFSKLSIDASFPFQFDKRLFV